LERGRQGPKIRAVEKAEEKEELYCAIHETCASVDGTIYKFYFT
jgi:hypothetical protein